MIRTRCFDAALVAMKSKDLLWSFEPLVVFIEKLCAEFGWPRSFTEIPQIERTPSVSVANAEFLWCFVWQIWRYMLTRFDVALATMKPNQSSDYLLFFSFHAWPINESVFANDRIGRIQSRKRRVQCEFCERSSFLLSIISLADTMNGILSFVTQPPKTIEWLRSYWTLSAREVTSWSLWVALHLPPLWIQ
jgi:hypothetical protein